MSEQWIRIGYSILGHSIWKRMSGGKVEMLSFSYTNDQVLYNQFSPCFLCKVSWLPIITNLGSLSKIRLNEYQLKSISFNYNLWYMKNIQQHKTKKVLAKTMSIEWVSDHYNSNEWAIITTMSNEWVSDHYNV